MATKVKLVPEEPTEVMVTAALNEKSYDGGDVRLGAVPTASQTRSLVRNKIRAAIAAAPVLSIVAAPAALDRIGLLERMLRYVLTVREIRCLSPACQSDIAGGRDPEDVTCAYHEAIRALDPLHETDLRRTLTLAG